MHNTSESNTSRDDVLKQDRTAWSSKLKRARSRRSGEGLAPAAVRPAAPPARARSSETA